VVRLAAVLLATPVVTHGLLAFGRLAPASYFGASAAPLAARRLATWQIEPLGRRMNLSRR
jgi:hypothetical protein